MQRHFWSASKRVRNDLSRQVLGFRPRYGDYRSGLRACLAAEPELLDSLLMLR